MRNGMNHTAPKQMEFNFGGGDVAVDPMSQEMLTEVSAWMVAARVKVFKFDNASGETLEIHLHDSAFAAPPAPMEAAAQPLIGADTCRCGHEETSHNEIGCLHGCPVSTCFRGDES